MESSDWNTRKSSIDCAYTFGVVIPDAARSYAGDFFQVLNKCRSDKIKPVREAAVEAANVYKELCPEEEFKKKQKSPPSRPKTASSKPQRPQIVDEPPKQTRIGKGPVNPNFFKAQDADTVLVPEY